MTSQFSQVLDTKRCAPRPKYRKRPNARGTRQSHCPWHHGWGLGRSREGEIRKADLSSALNLNPGSRSNPPAKLSVIEMTSKKKNIVSTSSFAREAPLYPPNQCASSDENRLCPLYKPEGSREKPQSRREAVVENPITSKACNKIRFKVHYVTF